MKIFNKQLFPEKSSDPASPSSGFRRVYAKSDGVYEQNSLGSIKLLTNVDSNTVTSEYFLKMKWFQAYDSRNLAGDLPYNPYIISDYSVDNSEYYALLNAYTSLKGDMMLFVLDDDMNFINSKTIYAPVGSIILGCSYYDGYVYIGYTYNNDAYIVKIDRSTLAFSGSTRVHDATYQLNASTKMEVGSAGVVLAGIIGTVINISHDLSTIISKKVNFNNVTYPNLLVDGDDIYVTGEDRTGIVTNAYIIKYDKNLNLLNSAVKNIGNVAIGYVYKPIKHNGNIYVRGRFENSTIYTYKCDTNLNFSNIRGPNVELISRNNKLYGVSGATMYIYDNDLNRLKQLVISDLLPYTYAFSVGDNPQTLSVNNSSFKVGSIPRYYGISDNKRNNGGAYILVLDDFDINGTYNSQDGNFSVNISDSIVASAAPVISVSTTTIANLGTFTLNANGPSVGSTIISDSSIYKFLTV